MWVGFNSLIYNGDSPLQTISYLTTINKYPTNTSVVQGMMTQILQVATECYEPYAHVTYDLAKAKIAFQLQITEKPRFNCMFIHLGMFHVMMAYFKSVGKFIDRNGLTNIMVDFGLLAEKFANNFLASKHFNRSKRLHPLILLALEIFHFWNFVSEQNVAILKNVEEFEAYDIKRLRVRNINSYIYFMIYYNKQSIGTSSDIKSHVRNVSKLNAPPIKFLLPIFVRKNRQRYTKLSVLPLTR